MSHTLLGYTDLGGGTFQTDGSSSDVQAAITASSDGYTILIPSGTFDWATTVTVNKAVKIKGDGAGALVACSKTSATIGTGSFVFAIEEQGSIGFSVGQTLKAIATMDGSNNWMSGNITDISGGNVTINVTSNAGSGTWLAWTFALPSSTVITNSTGASTIRLENSSSTHYIELSGIHFDTGSTSTPDDDNRHFVITANGIAGKTAIIYDCRFSGNIDHSRIQSVNGLIYRCSFDCGFYSGDGSGFGNDTEALQFKAETETWSWLSDPTMGANDTMGLTNFYVEDCYFAGMALKSMDYDDHSRVVIRENIFDNSGLVAHGPDSSQYGARHFEIYDNIFVYSFEGTAPVYSLTYNISWWFWMRGGSGVITDNAMPAISGTQQWGFRNSLRMMVENLRRPGGPYSCWTTYPSPHQVGQGYENSEAVLDPLYIWNNTGTGASNITVADYQPDECGNGMTSADFIVLDRDYITGSAKPGWSKYTYPHTLRSGSITATTFNISGP